MAAKKAAISMSCFLVNKCGMLIGSFVIKPGLLYSSTLLSKNCLSSLSFILQTKHYHHSLTAIGSSSSMSSISNSMRLVISLKEVRRCTV